MATYRLSLVVVLCLIIGFVMGFDPSKYDRVPQDNAKPPAIPTTPPFNPKHRRSIQENQNFDERYRRDVEVQEAYYLEKVPAETARYRREIYEELGQAIENAHYKRPAELSRTRRTTVPIVVVPLSKPDKPPVA